MRKYSKAIVLSLTLILSMSCSLISQPGTPAPTSAPTGAAALTATPPATAAPAPTSSPAPPIPTHTPAPASLNASGPYIAFGGLGGVWITNPDGSFATRVSKYELQSDLRRAISPGGDSVAQVISTDQGLDLVLVSLPGGQTETIAHLLSINEKEKQNPASAKSFASYAITSYDSLAWQPGSGRLLAFIGAANGPTADVYIYDTHTKEITQLTGGPSQAIMPEWSPDGQYILHYGVSWVPPFGGAIVGPNRLDGVWSVQVSDGKVIPLPKPKGILPNFVGWQDDAHYITYDRDDTCDKQNLRSVDVVSGKSTPIMANSFYSDIAQSPQNGALLFSGNAACPDSLGQGVFLLLPGESAPRKLLDKISYETRWMPESQVFLAYPEALFSADGNTRYDPPVYNSSFEPAVSKKGYQAWEVIEDRKARVMIKAGGAEWQTILQGLVRQISWDPINGDTVLIAQADGSLYAATYPDFTPRLLGNLGGMVDQSIWLP